MSGLTTPPIDTRGLTMASWGTMASFPSTRTPIGGHVRTTAHTGIVHVKGVSEALHRRLRVASAEEGLSYAGLIDLLLDQRDARRERQRRAQASPLHRPTTGTDVDDESVAL